MPQHSPSPTAAQGPAANPSSDPIVARLVAENDLAPHPEGGYYRRIFTSVQQVTRAADGAVRPGLTFVMYLLPAGDVSRWHRLRSDEAWFLHDGDGLELLVLAPDGQVQRTVLDAGCPHAGVPAGHWQAARPLGAYALVSCAVGPGFDFADFELLADADPVEVPPAGRLLPDFERYL
ncbi:MAG: hypothetical protein RLZ55_1561 [Actinomycetota bacterium]|jgi:predicted cupin superfamily sugar epimerase